MKAKRYPRIDNSKSFNIGDKVTIDPDFEWHVKDVNRGMLEMEFYLAEQMKEEIEDDLEYIAGMPVGIFFHSSEIIQSLIKHSNRENSSNIDYNERYYPNPLYTRQDLKETTNGLKFHIAENTKGNLDQLKKMKQSGNAFWINVLLTCKTKHLIEESGVYCQVPSWLHPINQDIKFNPYATLVKSLREYNGDYKNIRNIMPFEQGQSKNSRASHIARQIFAGLWTPDFVNIVQNQITPLRRIELVSSEDMMINMFNQAASGTESAVRNISTLFEINNRYLIRLRSALPELHTVNQRIFEDAFLTSDSELGAKAQENLEILRNNMVGTIVSIQDDYAWCRDYSDEESLALSYLLPLSVLAPF